MDAAQNLTAFLGWILLVPAFYLLGRPARVFLGKTDPVSEGVFFMTLGMGIFVHLLMLLGLFHLFKPLPVVCLVAVIFAVGHKGLLEFLNWVWELRAHWTRVNGAAGTGLRAGAALLFGLTAILCFLPETANDALCYQLNVPKLFAWQASFLPIKYDFNSYTSVFMNSLDAVGLLFHAQALAKLFHWLTAFLLITVWTARLKKSVPGAAALFFGLLLFLTPTIFREASSAYVDVAVSLFIFLFFEQFQQGMAEEKPVTFFSAGLFLGLAAATKILILIAGVPAGVLLGWKWLQSRAKKNLVQCGLFFTGGILVTSGWWFVQSAVLTGNPFFPYFGKFFGADEFGILGQFLAMGPPKTLIGFLLLPLSLTFRPGDYDGGYPLGPFFLTALPFVIGLCLKNKNWRLHGVFVLLFMPVWYALFHNVRFLLPALVIFGFAGAVGIHEAACRHPRFKKAGYLLLGLLAVLLFAGALYHDREEIRTLATGTSAEHYLRRMERSYPAARWVNENLPADARILNAEEIRQFYFERETVRELWFYLRTHYSRLGSAESVAKFLKQERFTHLLLYAPVQGEKMDSDTAQRYALLRTLAADSQLSRSLVVLSSRNVREARMTYEIYELR